MHITQSPRNCLSHYKLEKPLRTCVCDVAVKMLAMEHGDCGSTLPWAWKPMGELGPIILLSRSGSATRQLTNKTFLCIMH